MSIDEHRAIRDCTPRYSICSDISRDKIIHNLWIISPAFTRALAALRIFPQRPWGRGWGAGTELNLVPRACDPQEGNEGSGIIRFREDSDWPLKWMRSSILATIPGFRQRIIPEPSFPSQGSQARGTRLALSYTILLEDLLGINK